MPLLKTYVLLMNYKNTFKTKEPIVNREVTDAKGGSIRNEKYYHIMIISNNHSILRLLITGSTILRV